MKHRIHPNLRRLERGQGALEYALMIVLVAIVAVPVVAILAPSDFREGAIYQRIYIPFLCAIQGRDAVTCEGTLGGGAAYSFGYPTAESEKTLGESGGSGGSGGGGSYDETILAVVSLVITGESQANLDTSDYTSTLIATGTADTVTLEVTDDTSTVVYTQTFNNTAADATAEFVSSPITAFQTAGTYTLSAIATKDTVDSAPETLTINIIDPDASDNLFGDVFQLIADPGTSEETTSFMGPNDEVFPGTYEIVGNTAGGTPAKVIIDVTGPVGAGSYELTSEPYAVFGGSGAALTTGAYEFTITPYDASDVAGTPNSVNLTVTEPPDPISVTGFTLVNATTDATDGTLTDGTEVAFTFDDLSAIAETDGPVGSVMLTLQRGGTPVSNLTENAAPYTVFGDSGGNYSGQQLTTGSYTLTATPYYGANGTGTSGTPLTITFEVGPYQGETIEAEDATVVGSYFVQGTNSGRTYMRSTTTASNLNSPGNADISGNYLQFEFEIPTAGQYRLFATIKSNGGSADSFWVSSGGGTPDIKYWQGIPGSWGEDQVSHDSSGADTRLTLPAGTAIIRFHVREQNTWLDKVRIVPAS